MARIGDKREERRSKPPTGRFTNFTPLNASIDQVLMQIKDKGALTFPSKLKRNPNKSTVISTAIAAMTHSSVTT